MPRAVILTTLSVEYLAIRTHLSELQEEVHRQGTIYEQGQFAANGQMWDVEIVEIGAGNPRAAMEAERAIAHFQPDVILFVGVAGGLKDVVLGDVVASTKVYGYESGKAEQQFKPRSEIGLSAYSLEQRARAEARKVDWLKRLSVVGEPVPRVFVAPIAAGEKVIASTQSEVFKFLREHYGDAIAVEMEGLGFLEAARANQQVAAMVIRGISDLIDGKGEADKAGSQEIAARHASAFAFEVLSKFQSSASIKTPSQVSSSFPQVSQPSSQATERQATPQPGEVKIFFSYSHKDEVLRDQLATHLSTLRRQGVIKEWHDRKIGAGKEWAGEIDRNLESAHIILLLVSADFINSDYCMDVEVRRAMGRHELGEAWVVPVILRPVDWNGLPFSKLQALPKDGKPITTWSDRDEAFLNVAQSIRSVVTEITANP
jgi:nucleoside phosphorylase